MFPPFVDREAELEKLRGYASRGYYPVLYLYGPEGCGKTQLLRELYRLLRREEGFVVVYVDAQSASGL